MKEIVILINRNNTINFHRRKVLALRRNASRSTSREAFLLRAAIDRPDQTKARINHFREKKHFPCFLAAWNDYDFYNHFPFSDQATSATAPDAPARPTALPAGGMLINQHDTSWRNDLRTRVDEVGNFLIYILHGANMHNLVVQVETAFDAPRLQRRNVSIRSRSTRADGHS